MATPLAANMPRATALRRKLLLCMALFSYGLAD
jgi:hypothetical protein